MNFEDKWVIVTGASGGLGREIALFLAKNEGANLIIVARRTEKLKELKTKIENETDSKVDILTLDLSENGVAEKLYKQSIKDRKIYALINNAGLTVYEVANTKNFDLYEKIINLNYKTPMFATLLFLDYFKKSREGGIMNISSMGGIMPMPYQAVYSSSKHAISGFTFSLIAENKNSSVNITLFSPGGIKTDMVKYSGLEDKFGKDNIFNSDARKVAKSAVIAFKKGKTHSIPGIMNKIANIIQRLISKKSIASIFEKSYRRTEKE